jgi:hypothetical protein
MSGEPFVQVSVVSIQKVEDAAILTDKAAHEHPRFLVECGGQRRIELRICLLVRLDVTQTAQSEPLRREVVRQTSGTSVGEHASNRGVPHLFIGQLCSASQIQKIIVGDAAPQEERQPGRQLKWGDGVNASWARVRSIKL